MLHKNKRDGAGWFWPLCCFILTVILLFLVYQNLKLKGLISQADTGREIPSQYNSAKAGDIAPPIKAYSSNGELVTIGAENMKSRYILGWYEDNCDACYFAREGWNTIAAEFPGAILVIKKSEDVVYDSLFFGKEVDFPIFYPVDTTIYDQYNVTLTPQTMIINPEGTVLEVWLGAPGPDMIEDIIYQMGAMK